VAPEAVGVVGFVALLALLALRVPVAIAMLAVAFTGYATIVSPRAALARLGLDAFQEMASYTLSVVPLFILMGLVLAHARLGEDVYTALDAFLWRVRGGLATATRGAAGGLAWVSGCAVA
jgi:TRAP-type mannitol/chloroaromatic compound transport system permease large subunit